MKALIKKEIRLLLPSWITAMLLAIVPRVLVIIWSETYHPGDSASYQVSLSFFMGLIFAGGVLFLGINSFGEELSCNTFSALLSQPIKRPRVWLIKVATLATAFISVWLVAILFVSWQFGVIDSWYPQLYLRPEFSDAFEFLTLSALVAFSGGLWTTLLLRQTTTAFWITLLMPLAIICAISVVLQERIGHGQSINTPIVVALALYSIAGFFVALRLFMRAQDIQWTGGEVSLPRRERSPTIATGSLPIRPSHWFSALAWKELQLHQATFLIAAIVLVMHLSAVFIRKLYPPIQNFGVSFILENIWTLWLLMPLLIGAAAIAEERRLGTLESQLCQPVSRSTQLFFKFAFALILSLFFGAVVPALIEVTVCGASLGDSGLWVIAERQALNTVDTFNQWQWVVVIAAAIFFVSFYASSLGRTALQGIGFAMLVSLIIFLGEVATFSITVRRPTVGFSSDPQVGIEFLNLHLGAAILLLVLGGLTVSNFKHAQQNRKFWLRNIAAILAVFICVPIAAREIYFRPWESLLPLEPRGPVRITSPDQVKFVATRDAIYAISPNGRLRVQPVTYGSGLIGSGHGQFVSGSNWVDVAATELEVLAVQSNGTLWRLGGDTGPVSSTQIGTDNDWSHVASGLFSGFLILKKDGSLWAWGTHPYNWPSLHQKLKRDFASPPVRVSDDTNWTALYSMRLFSPYARDKSGNIWLLLGNHMKQETNVDNQWLSLQSDESLSYVEVRTNGDLSYFDQEFYKSRIMRQRGRIWRFPPGHPGQEQLGEPWKWKTAAFGPINGGQTIVAIRSNGTLWKFPLRQPPNFSLGQPVQLGTRSDWVAVSQGFSLAPDGSIWAWDQQSKYIWLAPSHRPVYMGNIFE